MQFPWDFGKISRNEAEQMLLKNGKNGAFLVRQSESIPDAYVLSLWFDKMVHHYRILKKEDKFLVQYSSDNKCFSKVFSNLEEVIELYKQRGTGLVHPLTQPLTKETNVNDGDEFTDDEDEEEKDFTDCPWNGSDEDVETISSFFLKRMQSINTSEVDSDFCNSVKNYLKGGFERDGDKPTPVDLQELIINFADGLKGEVKQFLKKILFLQDLFSTDHSIKVAPTRAVSKFEDFMQDLATCVAGIKTLQTLVKKSHKDYVTTVDDEESRTFEVTKCDFFKTKLFLKVDVSEGKLLFMKSTKDSIEDCYLIIEHDEILQLVKDQVSPKLTLNMKKEHRKLFLKDIKEREKLCLLVHHMLNLRNPNKNTPKSISVFVGTWNMGNNTPAAKIDSWLCCKGLGNTNGSIFKGAFQGHDIFAIGTQESGINETSWIAFLKKALKRQFAIEYDTVGAQSLWGMRLVILAKPEHANRISRVVKSTVKTGIANAMGNKGGVGISFDFLTTSLCFINCHLTSGSEKLRKERRGQNFSDILKGLNLGHKGAFDLTNQFHDVFWFGDLNYRIDMSYEEIMKAIEEKDYQTLLRQDQLTKEKNEGNVFFDFCEDLPCFPPTYRYKKGTRDTYLHIKSKRTGNDRINVPSWCDRVLYKSFPDLKPMQVLYGCTEDIVTSDHSPVFASFEVPVISHFVASPDRGRQIAQSKKPSCKIKFERVRVKLNTVSKTAFYLEFHSACLATSKKSKNGLETPLREPPQNVSSKQSFTSCLEWSNPSYFPELNPILDNPEYLREQYMLIAVKSEAGDESYGEYVIPLNHHLSNKPLEFEGVLTHGGIRLGEICGTMNVINKKQTSIRVKQGSRAHPSTAIQNRPYSCVAPASDHPPISPKSVSLPRAPPRNLPPSISSSRNLSGHSSASTSKFDNYVSFLNPIPSTSNKIDVPTDSSSPPPLPAKKKNRQPKTVEDFLCNLGLQTYIDAFNENGFDDLEFLENLTSDDLKMFVINSTHIQQILDAVRKLKNDRIIRG